MSQTRIIGSALVTLVLLCSVVAGFGYPMPIAGKVINEGDLSGIKVIVTNHNTGESHAIYTDTAGHFLIEWANTLQKAEIGDRFTIESNGVSVDAVFQGAPIEVTLDLRGKVCPKCPECPEDTTPYAQCDSCCPEVVCPEPEPCPECPSCPECPEIPECPVCPECPVQDWNWILFVIGAVAGAGIGIYSTRNRIIGKKRTGIKIYTKTDGTVATLHKHPGIRGYHNPNTIHKNTLIRHKRGELFPIYKKDSTFNKWVYIGGD